MSVFRNLSIGRQVLIATLVLCALVFGTLNVMVSVNVGRTATEVAEKDLKAQLKVVADLMDYAYRQGVNRAQRDARQFIKTLPGPITVEAKTVKTGLVELPIVRIGGQIVNADPAVLEKYREFAGVDSAILMRYKGELYRVATLLKDKDGKPAHGSIIPKGDPQERAYAAGVESGAMVDRNGRTYCSYMIPVKDEQGNMIAAVIARSDLTADMTEFKNVLGRVTIGKTGYPYAFRATGGDEGGVFTVHPKLEGKTLKETFARDPATFALFNQMIKAKGGVFHYMWPDAADGGKPKDKFAVFLDVPSWGWMLGGGAHTEEFLGEAHALRNQLIIESALGALLLVGLIYWLIMSSLRRIKPVLEVIDRQGAGDLTARVAGVNEDSLNELDVLARRFNQSGARIQALVEKLAVAVARIGSASDELDSAAGEIAKSTSQQSDAAASMAASVEELTVSVGQVADSAAEASESTTAAKQASGDGRNAVACSLDEMQRIATHITDSAQQINQLGERSRQISGIIKVIGDIAGQTNLLALNAAIEAARAGEQGRGFAVVADEVRKLSERTATSAREIAEMIGTVQAETQSAVERMNAVVGEVTGGVQLVQNVGVSLEKIDTRTQQATALAQQIATAVREQKVASEDIARRLESIAQAAEENTALTGNNRDVAQALRQCAGDLQSEIRRFRI